MLGAPARVELPLQRLLALSSMPTRTTSLAPWRLLRRHQAGEQHRRVGDARVDGEVVQQVDPAGQEQHERSGCAAGQRPEKLSADLLPTQELFFPEPSFLLESSLLLEPGFLRALLPFALLLFAPLRLELQSPGLLLECLALDPLEQGVDARPFRTLVEGHHAQTAERRDLRRHLIFGRRCRAADQDRDHAQRLRSGRVGQRSGAQADRLRDLVANPVDPAQARLQQLGPARADDDENDVGSAAALRR